ncbi:MAG: hypothetical protein HKO66_12540 [Saprospiraceae bacterium]|nr:hypothetical protein [Bacteroidia bacterium]NNE13566.1 hypothetical protein [Saprospiraceae bacterium]NNL93058.1 hypothetical protein [Saprospiraceae bacterium]
MKKSTLIAGIVGAIALYVINSLFYGMSGIMDGYSTEAGNAVSLPDTDINHISLALGHIVLGLLISMIYSNWTRGTHSFMHGARLGALLGALMGIGLGLIFMATTNMMSTTGHLVDGAWNIISFAITGGVVSIMTGKFEDNE